MGRPPNKILHPTKEAAIAAVPETDKVRYRQLQVERNGKTETFHVVCNSSDKALAALAREVFGARVLSVRKPKETKQTRLQSILERYAETDDPRVLQLLQEIKDAQATKAAAQPAVAVPTPPTPAAEAPAPPAPLAG